MSAHVLVIDDEEALRVSVAKIVSRQGHSVDTAGTATEGLDRLSKQPYELLLTDFRLPDLDGLEVLARARAIRPDLEVVPFTGFGSIPLAVQAIKLGACDFVTKPFRRADLERVVPRALEEQALAADNRKLRLQLRDQSSSPLDRTVGQSEAIRAVMRVVEQVAPSTATVLIEGPSGTGKELVAEALHAVSPRRDRPQVNLNCGAIPETLLEAELFGYERGAATGAVGRKDGRFAPEALTASWSTRGRGTSASWLTPWNGPLCWQPAGPSRSTASQTRPATRPAAGVQRWRRSSRYRSAPRSKTWKHS